MRFSVTSNSRVRFSVDCAFPHLGKRRATSRKSALCNLRDRKSAFCPDRLTQSRTLRFSDRTDCAFPSHRGAREVWGNPPASLRGTMENASTGQTRSSNPPPACGGGCARARKPRPGVWLHGGAQSGQRASLMARPGQVGTPSSCQLWAKEVPGTQDQPDQSRNRPVRKETPAKGRLRVRVRSRSHPGRGVLTSAQRLRVRSPSRPALPLAPECSVSYVHHRVAVYGAPPSTFTTEWQCTERCPARSPPSGSVKYTATRSRAYRSHCHSALIVPIRYARCCLAVRNALPLAPERAIPYVHHRVAVYGAPPSTLTAEWQCETHCPARSPPSGSVRRTATRPRAYRSHCHSALIVPIRYARCRLAVRNALPLAPERAAQHVHCRAAV